MRWRLKDSEDGGGDSHAQGFGFVSLGSIFPLNDHTALVGRVMGSYLYYNFDTVNGTTDVKSPGVTQLLGTRFSGKGITSLLLGGAEERWNRTIEKFNTGMTSTTRELKLGVVTQGMIDIPVQSWTWMNLFVNYSGVNHYTFGRLGLKHQITNKSYSAPFTLFVGLEGIGQGNTDILSAQGGGLLEGYYAPGKLSLAVSGGYKNSWFPDAPQKRGGYIGVNFYTSFK